MPMTGQTMRKTHSSCAFIIMSIKEEQNIAKYYKLLKAHFLQCFAFWLLSSKFVTQKYTILNEFAVNKIKDIYRQFIWHRNINDYWPFLMTSDFRTLRGSVKLPAFEEKYHNGDQRRKHKKAGWGNPHKTGTFWWLLSSSMLLTPTSRNVQWRRTNPIRKCSSVHKHTCNDTHVHVPRVTVIISLSSPDAREKLPLKYLKPNSPLPTRTPVLLSDLCPVLRMGRRGHLSCCHLSCHLSLHPNASLKRPHGRAPALVLGPKFIQASGYKSPCVPGLPACLPASGLTAREAAPCRICRQSVPVWELPRATSCYFLQMLLQRSQVKKEKLHTLNGWIELCLDKVAVRGRRQGRTHGRDEETL